MISFRPLTDFNKDYFLLYNWCSKKHVYEWFEQRILSYDEIVNKYKNKLKEGIQDLYIINYNNKDIGLIQLYKYSDNLNIKELNKYCNTYEYDLFIGEEDYLNKGLGVEIINKVNNMIYKVYCADSIILRPFKKNIRAIKCYLKCNFKNIYEYVGTDTLGRSEDIVVLLHELNR